MRGIFRTALFILIIASIPACSDSNPNEKRISRESDSTTITVTDPDVILKVSIPEYPFADNDAIEIDIELILSFAHKYIEENGYYESDAEFFLGWLPLLSADRLCSGNPDQQEIRKLLGNLYISGYFGGIWLRDANKNDTDEARTLAAGNLPDDLSGELGEDDPGLVFKVLIRAIELKLKRAWGTDTETISAARLSMSPFLMIYGYNWRYFDYIMKNPPETVLEINSEYECSRMLDCYVPAIKLETLDRYKPAREHLEDPKKAEGISVLKWYEMMLLTAIWAEGAVSTGSGVWENIMNSDMNIETYELLIDLSARFMLVAEMSLLPAMKGYAERNSNDCRCGLKQQAAMIAWAGSYFMGLSSDLPEGTFPKIEAVLKY